MTRTNASHRYSALSATALVAARPLGRAALSCGLAGALTLGAAAVASAGERPSGADQPGSGRSTAAQGHQEARSKGGAHDAGATGSAAKAKTPASAPSTPARHSGPSPRAAGHGADAARPEKSRSAEPGHRADGKSETTGRRGHDPAGNNGTIKVDGAAWDARVDNEPHPSCAFRVTFFGFDEGQTADITVTGVAPTGGGVLLHETAVPTSDDAAGGAGQDFDGATRVFTADDLGLDAVTPHPKQGYHLKVAVDSLEAPGGAKQKVFWLKPCEDRSTDTPPAPGVPGGDSQTPPAPGVPGEGGSVPGSQPEVPMPPEAPAISPRPAEVTDGPAAPAEAADRETSAPAAELTSSVNAVRPTQQASALPTGLAFTGAGGLGLMALVGAGAAAAGTALQVARRRAAVRTD